MFRTKLLAFLLTLPLFVVSTSWAAPTKILPLGDSITSDGDFAYRDELYKKLDDAGYDFKFVGSINENGSVNEPIDHEGHSGWRADEIDASLTGWLGDYDADIALIHLGTNDILQGQIDTGQTDVSLSTLMNIENIISKIDADDTDNSGTNIFVAKLLPLGQLSPVVDIPSPPIDLSNDYSVSFNTVLDGWTKPSNVTLVDQHSGVNESFMNPDMVHPNAQGENKMAQTWFDALTADALIPPKLTLTSSVPTTGGASFTVTATSTATAPGGAISYSPGSTGICAVNQNTGKAEPQAAGTCEVIATQEATASYAQAVSAPLSIIVTDSPQNLVFDATTTKTYGDSPFAVSATSFDTNTPATETGLAVEITSLTTDVCSYNSTTKRVTILKGGTCTLEATQAGGLLGTGINAIIYAEATPVTESITIEKAKQNITFNIALPLDKTFGDDPFDVTATSFNTQTPPVATGLAVEISTTTSNVCTYSSTTKKVTILSAGVCTLKAVQQGNDNYQASSETTSVTISAKGQTISFPAIGDKAVDTAPFDISAVASSGLPVSFSSSTTNVCTVSNKTVTLIATGTCRISATAGNSNNTAASATQEFEVTKLLQTITFNSNTPTSKTTIDSPFSVSAASTSSLAVTIKSTTLSVCTIDANKKVTIRSAGSCILKAEQSGDATYKATSATHTITVSVANTTYDTVVDIINGNSTALATNNQLQSIGLKNLNDNYDYTKALKSGTYKNKAKPTTAELQKVIDDENKKGIKTAGSTSALWLTLLSFITLYRRRKVSL